MSSLNTQSCINCQYYNNDIFACAVNPKHCEQNIGQYSVESTACQEFKNADPVNSLVMLIISCFESSYMDELTSEATFTSVGEKYAILGEHYNKGCLETKQHEDSFWISWSLEPNELKFTISCSS
ncbi:MAG: hypothetical protein KME64_41330 [Scytonematopsis contorta HA4267-MV1]|jgi:hypothetical protein|nr:hypothetical protein [Scytonematopsis contorta HA4267-MV1]